MAPMNWISIAPEALLLVLACVVALADLFSADPQRRTTFWLAQLSRPVASPKRSHISRLHGMAPWALPGCRTNWSLLMLLKSLYPPIW